MRAPLPARGSLGRDPPSTSSATPVMNEAPSEARNSAAAAHSSGRASRPSGWAVANSRRARSGRGAARRSPRASGCPRSRDNRVDADPLGGPVEREGTRQLDRSPLGGAIDRRVRLGHEPGLRGHHNQTAGAPRERAVRRLGQKTTARRFTASSRSMSSSVVSSSERPG